MSFGKKLESSKVQRSDGESDIKYKVFERLSEKGFLNSMQQQMRKAIAEELNDTKSINKTDEKEEEFNRSGVTEEGFNRSWESLTKVSSIANWEKQIRYELEIDREIQTREFERQKEKLRIEWRKLNERDKSLRIELDARERKLRLKEEELKTNSEDINQKLIEIAQKEEIINDIVNEKIKSEMKDEIEKLKKKFNELEINKLNLTKREEKVKEVEARLHEQVKIVKEKIDNKRFSEIELAKYRKELEIIKKENEVLKKSVESMEDYQMTKFENKSLKNELNAIKETLKNKIIEFDCEKEKYEKEFKISDEKVLKMKMDLRKCDQELLLLKQRHQGDLDELNHKLEQINNQLKQSKLVAQQLALKNHLLTKEIISSQNEAQKLMRIDQKPSNTWTQTDVEKFGCHLCDHNFNTIEESSLQFLASTREGLTDLKTNTQLVDEQNDLKIQLLSSAPIVQNQDYSNFKSSDYKPLDVPFINSNISLSPTQSNAIKNTINTSAKLETNLNGSQSTHQTNYENKLTNGKELQKYSNEKSKHYRKDKEKGNESKDNSIEEKNNSDAMDW